MSDRFILKRGRKDQRPSVTVVRGGKRSPLKPILFLPGDRAIPFDWGHGGPNCLALAVAIWAELLGENASLAIIERYYGEEIQNTEVESRTITFEDVWAWLDEIVGELGPEVLAARRAVQLPVGGDRGAAKRDRSIRPVTSPLQEPAA